MSPFHTLRASTRLLTALLRLWIVAAVMKPAAVFGQQSPFNLSGQWYGGNGEIDVVQTGIDVILRNRLKEYPTVWTGKVFNNVISGTWSCPKINQKGDFKFTYNPLYKPGYMERIEGIYSIDDNGVKQPRDFYCDREIPKPAATTAKTGPAMGKISERTQKMRFKLTGPFIERKGDSSVFDLTAAGNELTWTDKRTGKSCTLKYEFSAPASLSVGDKATFSANLAGDPDASPLISFLVEGNVWVAVVKAVTLSLSPVLRYPSADARTYEMVDGNRVLNDYVRQHPDKASKLQGALTRPIVFHLYATGGDAGNRNISIRWIYVPEKQAVEKQERK